MTNSAPQDWCIQNGACIPEPRLSPFGAARLTDWDQGD